METPYNYLIRYHKEVNNIDYSHEINSIVMMAKLYHIPNLEKNKTLKWQRDELILLLQLLNPISDDK